MSLLRRLRRMLSSNRPTLVDIDRQLKAIYRPPENWMEMTIEERERDLALAKAAAARLIAGIR